AAHRFADHGDLHHRLVTAGRSPFLAEGLRPLHPAARAAASCRHWCGDTPVCALAVIPSIARDLLLMTPGSDDAWTEIPHCARDDRGRRRATSPHHRLG